MLSFDHWLDPEGNSATPPWCLLSSAFTAWLWVAVYWAVDVRGWTKWAGALVLGGQNALLAYVLAPVLYATWALLTQVSRLPDYYDQMGGSFTIGFWRAVLFAVGVTFAAAALRRRGVQLRL